MALQNPPGRSSRSRMSHGGGEMFIHATVESLRNKIDKDENSPKKKRIKTSQEQLKILQESFDRDPKPSSAARTELGERLGMSPRAIQVWFQNRRAKVKLATGSNGPKPSDNKLNASTDPALMSNLFADLNASISAQTSADRLNEYVSDSDDDDASSLASSLFTASSVSTLGISQLNISGVPPRFSGAIHGNSVYGNVAFTRSLPDLHGVKSKQKIRMGWNAHASSNLGGNVVGWDNDDFSEASSRPGSPNPYLLQQSASRPASPNPYLLPNASQPASPNPYMLQPSPYILQTPQIGLSMSRPVSPGVSLTQPTPSIPSVITTSISPEVQPQFRHQRRHSLHAEQGGDGLPPNVLLQLQNNHLAMQQQQQLQQQQQQQQQYQQHLAFVPSTPASLLSDGGTWMRSPGEFTAVHSPEIQQLQYQAMLQGNQGLLHPSISPRPSGDLKDMINQFNASTNANAMTPITDQSYSAMQADLNGITLGEMTPFSVADLMQASMFTMPQTLTTEQVAASTPSMGVSLASSPALTLVNSGHMTPAMQQEMQKLMTGSSPITPQFS
ncbi:hypothetical protein HDU97_006861 [Phlyctochytrium planicorne]|nr:hypothetical protein HDU97_006861 [Phlyctochytrium planicorne]